MDIREITISLTNICNVRCTMCGIWKSQDPQEFNGELLSKLPQNFKTITNVSLPGGEPFLHKDIPGIIKKIKNICPYARIVISTK